jgi:nitroimidazol reductase NimA-like FMN-containing flavoprotein (pyridoxamine 5'-phosphate oxidase superfamily)
MRRKEKEITDNNEIERIILKSDVCHVAMAFENIPYIVAMNFGYENISGKRFYFHCAKEGKKLEMLRKNNFVCFSIDTDHVLSFGEAACESSISYSSILGYGHITIIDDDEGKKKGLDCIMKHYSDGRDFEYKQSSLDRTLILKLDITELTGKKG